jgi:hypothetical protein
MVGEATLVFDGTGLIVGEGSLVFVRESVAEPVGKIITWLGVEVDVRPTVAVGVVAMLEAACSTSAHIEANITAIAKTTARTLTIGLRLRCGAADVVFESVDFAMNFG